MCFISTWVWEASEYFSEYITCLPGYIELKGFIEYLDIPGIYEEKYPSMPAPNLVLLKGDDNETYSKDELSYLDYVLIVETVSALMDEDEITFFEIKLTEINNQTKDLVACALIKIFNKAFKTKNVFIFKCEGKMSIGCRYFFGDKPFDDFCLTKWYSSNDDLVELIDISLSYYNSENLNQIIMNLSDQIMNYSHMIRHEDNFNDFKYVRYFDSEQVITFMNKSYTIRYSNDKVENETHLYNYRQISDELKFIAPDELTSYDYLGLAQKIEENSMNNQYAAINKSEKEPPEDLNIDNLDSAVFYDAVTLLNLLNDRNK